jgi:hypothetical protein
MGNASSATAVGALDDTAGAPPSEGLSSRSARLFAYDAAACKWNVERALVDVDFADDAAEGDAPDWHVEVCARNPRGQLLRARHAPIAPPVLRAPREPTGGAARRRMRRFATGDHD